MDTFPNVKIDKYFGKTGLHQEKIPPADKKPSLAF